MKVSLKKDPRQLFEFQFIPVGKFFSTKSSDEIYLSDKIYLKLNTYGSDNCLTIDEKEIIVTTYLTTKCFLRQVEILVIE